MTAARKKLLWIGVPIALVFIALVALPVLLEGPIEARAKAAIERRVDARVDWRDADLSLLRAFPHLALTLDDFIVTGTGAFERDTLALVPGFRLVLDLGSVLRRDQTVIRSVRIDSPTLHFIVLEDGKSNWDIVRPGDDASAAGQPAGKGLDIGLRRLDITNARITFDNRQSGQFVSLDALDHTLKGDFTRDIFTIETRTHSDAVTIRSGGVPWLADVALDIDADVDADLPNRTFTFGDNSVRLNDLVLAFTGSIAGADDDIDLNIRFDSPRTDFRGLLSLVPTIYANDFESIRTTGGLSVDGTITGRFGERAFPGVAIRARVDDATFQYPDLPLPARDIAFDVAIDNPGGDADSTVVEVRRLHARIGEESIDANMTVRTPVSDPDIAVTIAGVLDLAAAARTFRMETVDELSGVVNADVAVHARKSAIDAGMYERVDARGDIVASNVVVRAKTLPHRVAIDEFALGLSPRTAELRALRGTVGSSDVRMTGSLENVLGFAMGSGDLRGRATFESNRFDLTEWQPRDSVRSAIPVPPRLDLELRTAIAELHHGRLDMTDARGIVRVKDRRLTLDGLRLGAVGGEFRMTGYYETTDPARPVFDVDLAITNASVAESFEALTTVRLLAPVANYAEGRYSTSLRLNGPLGTDMTPILTALTGRGALETSQVVLRDFPPMQRLADALKIQRLHNPALRAIQTAIEIRDGRLHVRPFDVGIGTTTLTVGGSNGIDRSLSYNLVLALPQSSIESGARQALGSLFDKLGTAVSLDSMSIVRVGVRLTGTVDDPSLELDVGRGVQTALQSLEETAKESIDRAAAAARAEVDSARAAAIRRAEAEAARIVGEASRRADIIRAEARDLAESIRTETGRQADSLVARASNAIARLAAERAADKLRSEGAQRADGIVAEADGRADSIVAEARQRADALIRAAGGEPATPAPAADTTGTDAARGSSGSRDPTPGRVDRRRP